MCLVTSKKLVGSKDKGAGLLLSCVSISFILNETVFYFLFFTIFFLIFFFLVFRFLQITFFSLAIRASISILPFCFLSSRSNFSFCILSSRSNCSSLILSSCSHLNFPAESVAGLEVLATVS